MLPRTARLRSEKDHLRVRRFGRQVSDPAFALRAAKSQGATTRVAVVVSKKVDRRAVVRNRVRRRFREIFRAAHPNFRPSFDVLLLARPASNTLPMNELRQRVLQAARRLALLP